MPSIQPRTEPGLLAVTMGLAWAIGSVEVINGPVAESVLAAIDSGGKREWISAPCLAEA